MCVCVRSMASAADNSDWLNADFERARAPGSKNASQYAILEESWWEQREWGITMAVDTLVAANHSLAAVIQKGFDALRPEIPDVSDFELGQPGQVFSCGSTSLAFDATGSVSSLVRDGYAWADANHTLLSLKCA